MPHITSGPTFDASLVLASRRLDEARDMAQKNGDCISPSDLKIARDKVLHAAEIEARLKSKPGLSKYLQAREFRKSAKEALRFVKTISDRVDDEVIGQRLLGLNPMLTATDGGVDVRLFAEMKPNVMTRVKHLYHFKMSKAPESIRFNVELTKMLLRDMNFIYPEARDDGKCQSPYSHPIIQEAINVTLFRSKEDVGVVYHEHFSPMPIPTIALMLTVVQCCIDEWSDGQRRDSNWDEDKLQAVYASHVSSLLIFQAQGLERNIDVLSQLQSDLLRNAREHARVPPYQVTESGGRSQFTPPYPLSPIKYPDPEPNTANPNEKITQLARKSSTGPPTQEQPQHPKSSSSEAHGASRLQNATPAVLGRSASVQITHERNPGPSGRPLDLTGVNSKPRLVPEDDVSEGSTEYHAKFAAPHSSSSEATRLELERQLSALLAAQTERDQRIARLTDEVALKSALLEQAETNAAEAAKRAGPELREHADRLLMQTSLVEQRDAELVDMQSKLRNAEAKIGELLLSFDQQIGRHGVELANVRAKLEAKKFELEAFRLRLTDAKDGWAKSKAKADKLHTVTAGSLVDLNEDRDMCELKEDMEAGLVSLQWNEKSIEEMECRNEG